MEFYFLKSAACLAVLLLFYKLLLEKEDMHVFNRFFLLFSVVISFLVPFITFTTYLEVPVEPVLNTTAKFTELPVPPAPEPSQLLWPYALGILYGLGVLLFGIKFFLNLKQLILKIKRNERLRDASYTTVLLKEDTVPHTFLDYIFLNKKKFEQNSIPREVFEHERAHASQKHSYDLLFMELLQVVFWFHPLLYLAKKEIKLNHEFLADKSVLKKGTPTGEYQQLLLAFSSKVSHGSLAHPINYSFIKKRFTVMKTQTPKWAIWARSLLVLPVAALLLYGFSTREVVERENKDLPKKESSLVQEKVTPEMLEEYNKLAKYYNSLSEEHSVVRMKDLDRMRYIYKLMTPEQKKNAEPLPSIYPPPPPPPPAPPVAGTETVPSPPPVPPAPTVSGMEIPGPPPPPPSPVEHIKELAAKGARFFHAGVGEISAETALKMVKNKNVSIRVRDYGSETSVHISVEK